MVAPDRFASPRDTIAFIVCLLLAVAARLTPPAGQEVIASTIRRTVLAPLIAVQDQAVVVRAARASHGALTAARDSATLAALLAHALGEENARLREALGLSRRLGVRHVPAEVLHQAGLTDGLTLVLSSGRDDGIEAGMAVVAPAGLVGVIRSVEPGTAVVVAWPHPDFRVSAMTADGAVFGIVAGRSGGPNTMLMELRGVPYQQRVAAGTLVYTSGLGGAGGMYPRGIPVGRVLAEQEEQEGWARTYLVQPAVHPASVSHVVVTAREATDLGSAFGGEVP